MNNKVNLNLTEDELILISTALQLSVKSFEKYKRTHGENSLDFNTEQVYVDMKVLLYRLEKEYF